MNKKNKRHNRPTVGAVTTAETTASTSSKTPGFNPDYSYVIKDLRRIGTLAGIFITIIIALSFILK